MAAQHGGTVFHLKLNQNEPVNMSQWVLNAGADIKAEADEVQVIYVSAH